MKRFVYMIMTMVMAVLMLGACQRRPFAEYNSKVNLILNINTDIQNHEVTKLPENMRVDMFDPISGDLIYTDYVGPNGGYIHPNPGTYDLIVYSIGSETTIIHNEYHFNEIEAYTNEVQSYLRSKGDNTSDVSSEIPVVYEPEHTFVGWYHNLIVPIAHEDEEVQEMQIEVDANTIVETWQVEIRNVDGTEWISEVAGIACGQCGSVYIGPNASSDRVVKVMFELRIEENDNGGKCLKGKYSSFGVHESHSETVFLDLSVKKKGGLYQYFHFNITDQMVDNDKRYILIEDSILIDESSGGGGGFLPVIDDWDDIQTDIKL